MELNSLTYYKWSDIRKEICKEMNITEHEFRNNNYSDLWLEWLTNFVSNTNNICYTNVNTFPTINSFETEWQKLFAETIHKIWNKYNIEYIMYY